MPTSNTMDGSSTTQDDLKSPQEPKTDTPASNKRKVVPKTVVTVRMEASVGKHKGEGPPSDSWSWRKYGQKPIKGSPYPRGYYRCSTSKCCSARKQVERCKTDPSVLLITYTCAHNHPISPAKLLLRNSPTPTSPKQHIPTCKQGPDSESLSLPSPPECSQASTQEDPEVESDFFDELEELPVPSSLTSLVRSSFFDERTLLFTSLSTYS